MPCPRNQLPPLLNSFGAGHFSYFTAAPETPSSALRCRSGACACCGVYAAAQLLRMGESQISVFYRHLAERYSASEGIAQPTRYPACAPRARAHPAGEHLHFPRRTCSPVRGDAGGGGESSASPGSCCWATRSTFPAVFPLRRHAVPSVPARQRLPAPPAN